MIAIVKRLKLVEGFAISHIIVVSYALYALLEVTFQFFLGEANKCGILWIHGDVAQVVKLREDAQLRELRDASDEHKT